MAPRTGLDSDGSRKVDDGAKEDRSSSYANDATGRQCSAGASREANKFKPVPFEEEEKLSDTTIAHCL